MATNQEDILYKKVVRYCSYQERTEKEIRGKLCAWGVEHKSEEERIIQALRTDRLLDEERYMEAFIRGKFLGKKWGKTKLMAVLTNKGFSQTLIQKGLASIEPNDYLQALHCTADHKKNSLDGLTPVQKMRKLANYLLQKGYEPDLVCQTVQELVVQQQN